MKRLRYVDTYCYGAFHEMFNASLLRLCTLAADQVDYVANRHTINAVIALSKGSSDLTRVRQKTIFIPAGYSRPIPVAVRYLFGVIRNLWYVVSTSPSVPLILNYNNAFALKGVNWLCRILGRKVIIFCHGEIELLLPNCKEHMGPIARGLQKRLSAFFVQKKKGFASGLRFVVLGDSILSNLKPWVSSAAFQKFRSLDHPYLFPTNNLTVRAGSGSQKKDCRLTLGTIGTMKRAKGLDNFRSFLAVIPDSVSVKIVGRLQDGAATEIAQYGVKVLAQGDTFLSREELEKQIAELDYILYFYYSDSYRLIASGAIFDAIAACRPILALHNDFFDYLFRKFGNFGYLEATPEALAARAEGIARTGDPHYAEFMKNIEQLRKKLHPDGLVMDFIQLLNFKI